MAVLRDAIDLDICAHMDTPPHGAGLSATETARLLRRKHADASITRSLVNGRWTRIREALAKSEGSDD